MCDEVDKMKKKKITMIVMLGVLLLGIACLVYGLTGRAIYSAATKLGR